MAGFAVAVMAGFAVASTSSAPSPASAPRSAGRPPLDTRTTGLAPRLSSEQGWTLLRSGREPIVTALSYHRAVEGRSTIYGCPAGCVAIADLGSSFVPASSARLAVDHGRHRHLSPVG